MQHAFGVLACGVDRAVNDKPGRVDGVGIVGVELHALAVDLDQAGGGDFLEHHAVGVDQELVIGAGNLGGDMGEDQIVPVVQRDQPVAGGEIDAGLPLFGGNLIFDRSDCMHGGLLTSGGDSCFL